MKKTKLIVVMGVVLGFSGVAAQAAVLQSGDVLHLTAGTPVFDVYGSLTNVSGSWFGMDYNGDSKLIGSEKNPLSEGTTGLVIGVTTSPGASHSGPVLPGDTNEITAPWTFFANTGSDYLTAPVTGGTTNGLDLSGWTVTWNGIPAIPMGTGAWQPTNCAALGCTVPFLDGIAQFSWNGLNGGAYTLDYTATVPQNDPSGFGGVQYYLHLEGTVTSLVPVPAAAWLLASGMLGLMGIARRKHRD